MTDLVARFEDVDMAILDKDGQRWVTAKQLAEALGYDDHRALIRLIDRHPEEFKDKTLVVKLTTSHTNSPGDMIINYFGVIRVGMLSDAPRAPRFRDWAERVLYAVMTEGSYVEPSMQPGREPHWIEQLDAKDRFRLMQMRYRIATMLVKHPEEIIFHGLLAETYGDENALASAIYERAMRIRNKREDERKANRKPMPPRESRGTVFDLHPEIRAFAIERFSDRNATFRQIHKELAERFGADNVPGPGTIGKEFKRWVHGGRKAAGQ